ncbi:MAG: hypothetical protein JSU72_03695 [Deltaproteobacteria bacterium]|nr:MAG: hypothetical protein JSU72_03695 [Deltaproteobacteria bacterium]
MWTKEQLFKYYHMDRPRLDDERQNAFFLASLLGCIGHSSDMGEPFIETCKGIHKIVDKISGAFEGSLSYLKEFAELVGSGQEEATGKEVADEPTY